jgi:hypothetical protein
VSQRSDTLCPPGSDRRIRPGGSMPAGGQSGSRRSSTLCPPEADQQIRDGGSPPTGRRQCLQRTGTRCPLGSGPAEGRVPPGPAAPRRPGAGGGGEARSRRRSRSTWSVASRGDVSISAAVPARLSPKDTRFSEQTRASNLNQSDGLRASWAKLEMGSTSGRTDFL